MSILDVLNVLFFVLWPIAFIVWLVCISVRKFRENGYYLIALIPVIFLNLCIIILQFYRQVII